MLARRLRASILDDGDQDPPGFSTMVERTLPPRGRRPPGRVEIPSTAAGEEERQERISRAIAFAKDFETDSRTFWTDGSALPGGTRAGAMVGFVEEQEEVDSDTQRVESDV